MYKAEKRLYTTADGSEVVDENDPRAAVLLAAEGMEIPDAQAERLGLTGRKRAAAPEPPVVPSIAADPAPAEEAVEAKAVSGPPENKARAAATRKADEDK
jgi:hypothetical protein